MESFKLKLNSSEFHLDTHSSDSTLFTQNISNFDHSTMLAIEKRITEWLEYNNIDMINPEEKKTKFFSEQRERSLSFKKVSERMMNFSLDISPLVLRHKKVASSFQKTISTVSTVSCDLTPTPEKNSMNYSNNFTLLCNEETTGHKSTLDAMSLSLSVEDLVKGDEREDELIEEINGVRL